MILERYHSNYKFDNNYIMSQKYHERKKVDCIVRWIESSSLLYSFFCSSLYVMIPLLSSFNIGLMIYRNEIPFNIETMLLNKDRLKSDVDPFDYVQYSHAIMECVEWKGTFIEIRFSWWSIGNFKGKICSVCVWGDLPLSERPLLKFFE